MAKTRSRRSSSASKLPLTSSDSASLPSNATSAVGSPSMASPADSFGFLEHVALTVTVDAVESADPTGRLQIWLSEAAMLEASISASQLVAVAVKAASAEGTPLLIESLEGRLSRRYRLRFEEGCTKHPGAYLALAVVWPSQKLNKYGAKLSKQLAHTLGDPVLGLGICVSSIKVDCRNSDLQRKWSISMHHKGTPELLIHECKYLSLEWCPPLETPGLFEMQSSAAVPDFLSHGNPSCSSSLPSPQRQASAAICKQSPMKTPLFASTPNEQKLQSPEVRDGSLSRTESKVKSNVLDFGQEGKLTNLKPIWSIFGREAEKAKMVVETFVSRWLQGCLLLSGSLVLIPVCGRDCVFRIKEAQTVPEVSEEVETPTNSSNDSVASTLSSEEAITAKLGSLALSCPSQPAFYVSCRTAITLLPPFRKREDNNESQPCISLESSVCPSKAFEGKKLEVAGARNTKYPLGGLSEQISTLMEIIEFSLLRPHLLTRFGLQPTRGVLLYGPPGSGKTSLAHAAVSEAGVNILSVNGPEVVSEFYGESEKALRAVFASAQLAAPCVVFIDELDAITPERKEGSEELAQRLVAELLSLMDGSTKQSLDRVLVIAATNRPEVIDPALRRPGRFDREIEVGVPTPAGRREILETLLLTMDHSLSVNDVESLAADTHGFVGADMAALCNEAAMTALRRYVEGISAAKVLLEEPSIAQQEDAGVQKVCEGKSLTSQMSQFSDSLPTDKVATNKEKLPNVSCIVGNLEGSSEVSAESCGAFELSVNLEDFQVAKTKVRPSAMREVMLEIPKVKWHDIGGQDEVKQQLKEAVEWPQKHGDAFSRIGAQPPRGVLLYGPPGCSKTLMARAVATETGLNFIAVKGPELFSKWVGESEKAVRSLFARARAAAPSVVFFDEIDGLAVARNDGCGEGLSVGDRVLSQLLVELDGLIPRSGVAVIAATNRPDKIDAALLRPGRLDRLLYVGPPSEASRCQIFEIHLRQTPCRSDVQIEQLAARTGGYTGADIAAVCGEAAMTALEEDLSSQEVCMRHFEVALTRVQPSDPGFNCTFAAKFQRGFNTNE